MHLRRTAARNRKGQSAIEYLTTYGWAILAVIIVGAVLVNMGIFDQCQETTPTFTQQPFRVADWGFQNDDTLTMSLEPRGGDSVNITDVNYTVDSGEIVDDSSYNFIELRGSAQELTFSVNANAFDSGACATGDITFTYDVLGGISDVKAQGTLGGRVP